MSDDAQIREWLNEKGVNGYSGSISVSEVVRLISEFHGGEAQMDELRRIRKLVESVKETVEAS